MSEKEYSQETKDTLKRKNLSGSDTQAHFDLIDGLTQFEMTRMLRFMPSGHIYFDNRLPFFNHFKERFDSLGGMTPEISKMLGKGPKNA